MYDGDGLSGCWCLALSGLEGRIFTMLFSQGCTRQGSLALGFVVPPFQGFRAVSKNAVLIPPHSDCVGGVEGRCYLFEFHVDIQSSHACDVVPLTRFGWLSPARFLDPLNGGFIRADL